jgi:hypothetical protein
VVAILPRCLGHRAESGGEVCGVEVLWCSRNWSLELVSRTARIRHGRSRCSGAQTGSKTCQRGACDHAKEVWCSERSRRSRDSPEFIDNAGSTGGPLSSVSGSLAADFLGFLEGYACGREGVL